MGGEEIADKFGDESGAVNERLTIGAKCGAAITEISGAGGGAKIVLGAKSGSASGLGSEIGSGSGSESAAEIGGEKGTDLLLWLPKMMSRDPFDN